MQLKSVISALTLATALGLAAPAYAQVSVGGTALSAEEEAIARSTCTDLQAAAAAQPIGANSEGSSAGDSEGDDEEPTSTAGDANVASGADQTATSFDVNTLTVATCEESGLLEPAADGGAATTTTTTPSTTTTPATNTTTTAPGNGVQGGNVSGQEDTEGGAVTPGDAANTGDEESTEESDAPAAQ